jgi:hypothetical protein
MSDDVYRAIEPPSAPAPEQPSQAATPSPPEDPRATYDGSYRSEHPDPHRAANELIRQRREAAEAAALPKRARRR